MGFSKLFNQKVPLTVPPVGKKIHHFFLYRRDWSGQLGLYFTRRTTLGHGKRLVY